MKKAIALFMILVALLTMSGCEEDNIPNKTNEKEEPNNYVRHENHYDYALIQLPSGKQLKAEISNWCTLSDGIMQITATDGTVYLVSMTDCVLVKENNQ